MTDIAPADIYRVMKLLPHRFPFLLVDRVLECEPGGSLRALKNVTVNEPYFPGHFPENPVMPGVVILEALAQACGLLAFATADQVPDDSTSLFFVGIDKARFRRPVQPGDQLILEVDFLRRIRDIWRFDTRALVDGKVVADARMMVATTGKET
jgi:3-hydroxyacyl-[acyl-carrier-protein] dehydratase